MKYELIFILVFFQTILLSQNLSTSKNVNDSIVNSFIDSCEKGNYTAAKVILEGCKKNSRIDPRLEVWITHYAFKYNDTTLFKQTLIKLIRENDFLIDHQNSYLSFYKAMIVDSGYWNHFYKAVRKNGHKEFVTAHLDHIQDTYLVDELFRYDQNTAISILPSDSCCSKLNRFISKVQRQIYDGLLGLCRKYGELPNNYDYTWLSGRKVETMLQHIFYDSTMIRHVWKEILPYYTKAFNNGKITNSLIFIYDKYLNIHFHYQYYGTIPNVPVIDAGTLAERKKQFLIK